MTDLIFQRLVLRALWMLLRRDPNTRHAFKWRNDAMAHLQGHYKQRYDHPATDQIIEQEFNV
jgi:hypothetical protein